MTGEQLSVARKLVPGRECGACTVCCKVLAIKAPELKKLPEVLCTHCTAGVGCAIYNARPQVCRDWHCGWRYLAFLGDEWRPDRSGILIEAATADIPQEFPRRDGLKFVLRTGALNAVLWPALQSAIASLVDDGVPVLLGIPGPHGYEGRNVFLNYAIAGAVAARNCRAIVEQLVIAVEAGVRAEHRKIDLNADD
ncbi:MAG: hypothetical protein ISS15_06670 [Alphaproteobacteria bacterium]|nr:hypothetical protein [Alphaproteobacteria bacterium]MBL7097321.1 hypothetical protein [Alphaproteobacteria bacterium]